MTKTLIHPTLAQVALPRASRVRSALLVLGGAALIAACAQVEVPLKPVPITLQTLAVLLAGATLGARNGALAVVAYVLAAVLGLPVLAGGGAGLAKVLGGTGGYLLGFVAAAALVGFLVERLALDRTVRGTALAMLAGNVVIYLFGLPWLAVVVPPLRDVDALLAAGLTPFLFGDALKLAVAALLLPSAWKLFRR